MKKTILSIFSILTVAAGLNAQIVITEQGTTTDVAGSAVTTDISTAQNYAHLVDLDITNNYGTAKSILITRVNLNNPAGWEESICWGDPLSGGVCYPHSTDNPWTSGAMNIGPGNSNVMALYITAPTGGSAHYRYYVTEGTTYLDSVDWIINSTLSLDATEDFSFNVSPNPANQIMNLEVNATSNVKMVDVLGNVVLEQTISAGKQSFSVADFKNGVYFIMIESEGIKPTTRKVIVRH